MVKAEEFIDIKKIEEIRKAVLNKPLDKYDNISWHIALKEDEKILGVARLYIYQDGIMIDKPNLLEYKQDHFELLYRTLLLKAVTMKTKNIYTRQSQNYIKYGFKPYKDNIMKAKFDEIKFPEKNGGCCCE